jgi:hypothetical protein
MRNAKSQQLMANSLKRRLLRASQRRTNYFNNSQGFKPVCFLNAAEKCEMEE